MRLDAVRARLDELGVDALLITSGDNRRYLSGFTGSAGALIITREQALLLTDSRYWEQAAEQAPAFELVQVTRPDGATGEQLERLGARRVGFEAGDVSVASFERLRATSGEQIEWIATQGVVEKLRQVKDAGELDALRRAIALTDEALEWMLGRLRPGMREREVAWELEKYMRERGASGLSFDTIVASGPNAARPHAGAGEREIQSGEPITIDMGGIVDGYHADLTRTVVLGEPDETFEKVYATVLEAQLAAERAARAGLNGREVDAVARDIIAAAGYGESFGHSLGHGVGLATHEGPNFSPRAGDDPLPEGATVTVEPGIYLPGWGGVRIEDIVVLRADGAEVLTRATKEPRVALVAAG